MRNLCCLVLVWLLTAGILGANPNASRLTVQVEGLSPDGQPVLVLRWPAISNALYRVESRASLSADAPWQSLDLVRPGSSAGQFRLLSEGGQIGQSFYRLVLPQPELFRVEPAVWRSSGGGQVFVEGQCLGSNAQIRVGGLLVKAFPLQPGSLYTFVAPTLPDGAYDLEWLENNQVMARLPGAIEISSANLGSQRLLEPPIDPPAAPQADHFTPEPWQMHDFLVQPFSGELRVIVTDLQVRGRGLHFDFKRTYRSRTGQATPMGNNWDHSYNIYIEPNGPSMIVSDGTGRRDLYLGQPDGTFIRPEFFNEGRLSNNVFVLTFPDTGRWEFNPFDGSAKSGKIARMADRNGNTMLFGYDAFGRLITVTDPLNRTNRLAYNAAGRIQSVTDFSGRTVSYTYYTAADTGGADGDLKSVTSPPITGTPNGNDFPLGKATVYTYSRGNADDRLNHNLLSVTDPKGQTWLQVRYATTTNPGIAEFDHVSSYRRGSNSVPETFLTYVPQTPAPANRFAVLKTILNDPVGNVTEMWFDSRNNKLVHRDLAARSVPGAPVTEIQNRPTAKLRENDPAFWETRYEWNTDSLCTRKILPRGNLLQFTYEGDLSKTGSVRPRANLRTVSKLCCEDSLANPVEIQTVRFQYDPRFGTSREVKSGTDTYDPWTVTDNDEGVVSNPLYEGKGTPSNPLYEGPKAVVSNPLYEGSSNLKNNPLYEDKGPKGSNPLHHGRLFVTRATDGRGNSDLYSYDAQGNLLAHEGRLLDGQDRPVESFEYNPSGQLTAHVHFADATGYQRRDEFSYYPATGEFAASYGWLRQGVVDLNGLALVTSYQYDQRGNVSSITDPRAFPALFAYNALNQVVRKVAYAAFVAGGADFSINYTTDFHYDANNNLVRIEHENRDEQGSLDPVNPTWTSLFEYDLLNRRTLAAHEATHTVQQQTFVFTRYQYDALDNLITIYSPEAVNGAQPENIVTFQYDTRNLLFRKTQAPGSSLSSTDQWDYDENGNLKVLMAGMTASGAGAHITSHSYDGLDRCNGLTDPMGNFTFFGYDQNNNLVWTQVDGEMEDLPGSIANVRLSETRFEYDRHDRLVRQRRAFFDPESQATFLDGESTSSFAYAPNGALTAESDDNGSITHYAYDTANRLKTVTDPRSNSVLFFPDASGFVTNIVRRDISELSGVEQIFSLTQFVDGLGRVTLRRDNQGNLQAYGYDSRGNVVLHRDTQQTTTRSIYDGLNRLTRTMIDWDGDGKLDGAADFLATQTWDDNSRLRASTDPNGNTTTFAYDPLDRLATTTTADGKVIVRGWDPHHKQTILGDANGTTVQFAYDLLSRCIRKDVTPGPGVAPATTFETFAWDGMSRLVRASNDVSMIEMTWDSLGNLPKQKQDCIAAFATFDGTGNRLTFTHPNGTTARFNYDSLNRLRNVGATINGTDRANLIVNGYEGTKRLGRVARANGINTRYNWNGVSGTPNNPGDAGWMQISRINHSGAGGGPVIDQRVFKYDSVENKIERGMTTPWVSGGSTTTNYYAYNKLHRLTRGRKFAGSTLQRDTLYQLDENGNRQLLRDNGVNLIYTMDPALPEPGDFQMNQYTGTPVGTHQYDANGNLVATYGPAFITRYAYDYANRLVSVSREQGPAISVIATYTYDCFGRRLSKVLNQTAPQAPLKTVYLYDGSDICEIRSDLSPAANLIYDQNHDLLLMVRNGALFYYHNDDLGSPLAITDEKAAVLERYEYDDYGKPAVLDGKGASLTGSTIANPFLFQGMVWDSEIALYHHIPIRWTAPELNPHSDKNRTAAPGSAYFNPETGQHLTRIHGDPHVDERRKERTPWNFSDRSFANDNPQTLRKEEGGRHTPFHNEHRPKVSDFGMSRLSTGIWPGSSGSYSKDKTLLRSSSQNGSTLKRGERSLLYPRPGACQPGKSKVVEKATSGVKQTMQTQV